MFLQNCNEESGIVPISGMDSLTHIIVIGVLLPLIGSIILSILFSRVLGPLYLKIKSKLLAKGFENGYIVRDNSQKKSKLVGRLISTTLLAFGFVSSFISFIDAKDWLNAETICSYNERGLDYNFHFEVFIGLLGIALPIAMGLLSISWALEDSGLMHYAFENDGMFEIEPIHNNYSGYLEGYAGIASLLFVIQFTRYQAENNSLADGALILAALLIVVVCFIPAYLIFTKIMKDHVYMRKGLKELKKLTEADLK